MTNWTEATKWICVVVCWLASFISGISPMKAACCTRADPKKLGVLNTFCAGVFMGIAFMHMIPETVGLYYD